MSAVKASEADVVWISINGVGADGKEMPFEIYAGMELPADDEPYIVTIPQDRKPEGWQPKSISVKFVKWPVL